MFFGCVLPSGTAVIAFDQDLNWRLCCCGLEKTPYIKELRNITSPRVSVVDSACASLPLTVLVKSLFAVHFGFFGSSQRRLPSVFVPDTTVITDLKDDHVTERSSTDRGHE